MNSKHEIRTEQDFANHIVQSVSTDPAGQWIFVADQLNTHKSEALVRFVAERCAITVNLGIKGKSGILKSMASRAEFSQDTSHRVRFVYTPKHSSWLNQIEIWLSILVRRLLKRASFTSMGRKGGKSASDAVRRLLKRASFTSKQDMRQRILDFITYFNQTMAKPCKWTFTGRPLAK